MKPIRLTWSGGRDNNINYGDLLSKFIVQYLSGHEVVYAGVALAELVGIGSIFHKIASQQFNRPFLLRWEPLLVWGTGTIRQANFKLGRFVRVRAVRGPRTTVAAGLSPDTVMGDPGLLAPILLDGSVVPKMRRIGFVPHVADASDPRVSEFANELDATLVDLHDSNIVATTRRIAECEMIVSSSLHGIIAADAFGIPNAHLPISDKVVGGDWKFRDYFESVGRPYRPLEADALRNLSPDRLERADPARVAAIQQALLAEFRAMNL